MTRMVRVITTVRETYDVFIPDGEIISDVAEYALDLVHEGDLYPVEIETLYDEVVGA